MHVPPGSQSVVPDGAVVGIGELLWDVFDDDVRLGGAPSNCAYFAAALGNPAFVASRVGSDPLGEDARRRLQALGVSTHYVQIDPLLETGTVRVNLSANGQPAYDITRNVGWDALTWSPEWEYLAQRSAAVCFGTLAQRDARARATIHQFLEHMTPGAIVMLDMNLRPPYFSKETIADSLERALVVKITDEELLTVSRLLGLAGDSCEILARQLCEHYALEAVFVTLGKHGSLTVSPQEAVHHVTRPVTVVDTVGAGDSFTAAVIHFRLKGERWTTVGKYANRLAAWVVGQAGATPPTPPGGLEEIVLSELEGT